MAALANALMVSSHSVSVIVIARRVLHQLSSIKMLRRLSTLLHVRASTVSSASPSGRPSLSTPFMRRRRRLFALLPPT